jgi:hypothetical protein
LNAAELAGLFHPTGSPARVVTIDATRSPAEEPADLLVVAQTVQDWRCPGWRVAAGAAVRDALGPEGIVWALAPRRRDRARLRRLVEEQGLRVAELVACLPNRCASRYLVPLQPGPVLYLLRQTRLERVGGLLLRTPGWRTLLSWAIADVAILAHDGGASGPARWLAGGEGSALMRASWRGKAGAAIVVQFADGATAPSLVAKVPPAGSEARGRAEAAALRRLGPAAEDVEINLPKVVGFVSLGARAALVEQALSGVSAAAALARDSGRLDAMLERLAGWLERWALRTCQRRPLSQTELERPLLDAARTVGLPASYYDWLAEQCRHLAGKSVPLTSAHNDLTMWNVLISESGRLGIIDWEEAEATSLPLGDLAYAAVDAAAATRRYVSRPAAYADCFVSSGRHRERVVGLIRRLAHVLELDAQLTDACLHACWLRHAANEQRVSTNGERSFRAIVERLAHAPRDLLA